MEFGQCCIDREKYLSDLYDKQIKTKLKPKSLQLFIALKDLLKEKVLSALAVLIQHGKLRRNQFCFQCRFDAQQKPKMDWEMQDFIEGMQLLLPEDVQLQYENYPVDLTQKVVRFTSILSINKAIKTFSVHDKNR
jgi:hypothetical protein